MAVMLPVFMVACGSDDPVVVNGGDTGGGDTGGGDTGGGDTGGEPPADAPPSATTVTLTPAPGGAAIPSNTQFGMVFDQGVTAASVNGAAATGSGLNWTASPDLQQGPGQQLNIEWTNRDDSTDSKVVGPYTVEDPDVDSPVIAGGGTVTDNQADVDPAAINASGFRFDFDEDVTGSIELQLEDGSNNNWTGEVKGRTATLSVVAGQELANETTYKVVIKVTDGANNPLETTLTFITKAKE